MIVKRVIVPLSADQAKNRPEDACQTADIREHVKVSENFAFVVLHVKVHLNSDADPDGVFFLIGQ